jgi:hypothetical protein
MFKLRDYQIRISNDANDILKRKGFVYLSMQVRTGKTITALQTCQNYEAKKVLFITKLKAFSSIQYDMQKFGFKFELQIINKESIHKIIDNDFDVIICDEAHGLFGTYPKSNKFTKEYRKRFFEIPCILLSGTMSPESYSQLFHQFWINKYAPFSKYTNFYKWAKDYVNITQKRLGYATVNDYSDANKKAFWHLIRHYILTFTQAEAGFTTNVNEMVLEVEMQPITYKLIDKLCKDLVITSAKTGKTILADTAVKLQQKVHQLSSGTIKFEDGTTQIIDNSKALFIKEHFKDYKIAIFYNFVAELEMLKETFGNKLTTDLEDFNTTDKWIALQIVSGREGISLAKADALVMMNIQFSAVSYFQSRDRLTTKERKENNVFWIFSKSGIESKIYQRVMKKLDYTSSNFKKDYGTTNSNENNKETRSRRILYS